MFKGIGLSTGTGQGDVLERKIVSEKKGVVKLLFVEYKTMLL